MVGWLTLGEGEGVFFQSDNGEAAAGDEADGHGGHVCFGVSSAIFDLDGESDFGAAGQPLVSNDGSSDRVNFEFLRVASN